MKDSPPANPVRLVGVVFDVADGLCIRRRLSQKLWECGRSFEEAWVISVANPAKVTEDGGLVDVWIVPMVRSAAEAVYLELTQ